MSWLFNSSFQVLWESILCFMFPCWNLNKHLPSQEESMIPLCLLKSMASMNMKWKTFWIQGSLIINFNILFIGMGMMWVKAYGNQSKTYQMSWKKFMNFINYIHETSLSPLLMELVIKRGGDVMNVNAMEFIHSNVHPWLVINLYLTFSLVSIPS